MPRSTGSRPPMADDGTAGSVAELRAQGLSVRAISERTGIPRSTVADRVARLPDAVPKQVTGRDGRHYRAVLRSSDGSEAPVTPTSDRRGSRLDGGLARALLLDQLRMARWLSADADPLTGRGPGADRPGPPGHRPTHRVAARQVAILHEGLHRRDRGRSRTPAVLRERRRNSSARTRYQRRHCGAKAREHGYPRAARHVRPMIGSFRTAIPDCMSRTTATSVPITAVAAAARGLLTNSRRRRRR